jgi:membrane protein implicated in regulation of membrane protease activity
MKLLDAILLAVLASFLIMGVYHTFLYGIIYSYTHFMIVAFALLWLNVRRVGKPASPTEKQPEPKKNKAGKKK